MKGQNLSMLEKQELVESYQSDIKKLQFQITLLKEAVNQLKAAIKEDKSSAPAISNITETAVMSAATEEVAKPVRRGRPKKSAPAKTTKKEKKATTSKRGRPKKVEAVVAPAAVEETAPVAKAEEKKVAPTRKPGRPKKASSEKKASTPGKRGRKPNQKLGGYRLSDWDQLIVDGIKNAGKALIKSELLDMAAQKNDAENLKLDEQALNVKISQSLHKLANRRDDLFKIDFPGRGFAYALSEWKTSKGDLPKKYTR